MSGENRPFRGWILPVIVVVVGAYFLVNVARSGTLNAVMKYQGYSDPQQVYDANLPIILDTLNTMAKEAKEIEKMNSKIKKK